MRQFLTSLDREELLSECVNPLNVDKDDENLRVFIGDRFSLAGFIH